MTKDVSTEAAIAPASPVKIEVISARSPEWANHTKTAITMLVIFSHVAEEIPFTASAGDPSPYAIQLLEDAKSGEFGPISEPTIITDEEVEILSFRAERKKALIEVDSEIRVLERIRRFDMASPDELDQLTALEAYSIQLMRAKGPALPQSPYVL